MGWAVGWERVQGSLEDWLSHRASWCSGQWGKEGTYSLLLLNFFCFVLKTGVCYVAQAGLELVTLLLQPPDCWDYRCVPTCLDCCYVVWKNQNPSFPLQASLEEKHSTWWPREQLHFGDLVTWRSMGAFTELGDEQRSDRWCCGRSSVCKHGPGPGFPCNGYDLENESRNRNIMPWDRPTRGNGKAGYQERGPPTWEVGPLFPWWHAGCCPWFTVSGMTNASADYCSQKQEAQRRPETPSKV